MNEMKAQQWTEAQDGGQMMGAYRGGEMFAVFILLLNEVGKRKGTDFTFFSSESAHTNHCRKKKKKMSAQFSRKVTFGWT